MDLSTFPSDFVCLVFSEDTSNAICCTPICVCYYLFGVLRRFQKCTGYITTGSFVGRGNQYIQLVKVLYCKLPTISKQLPTLPRLYGKV